MFGGGKKRHEKHSEFVDALSGIVDYSDKQLHELLEFGAISLEEYNSQKAPILDKLHSLYSY